MNYETPVETIFVTGGGRGIGRAIALDLAKSSNAALVLVSRTDTSVAGGAECNHLRPGSARALPCDWATASAQRDELFALVDSAQGPIGLVHAASTLGPTG